MALPPPCDDPSCLNTGCAQPVPATSYFVCAACCAAAPDSGATVPIQYEAAKTAASRARCAREKAEWQKRADASAMLAALLLRQIQRAA